MITNKDYVNTKSFIEACERTEKITGIPTHKLATPRQASKYRNNKGIVYKTKHKLI